MNSHVFQKLGVANKARLKYIIKLSLFTIVFLGIFSSTNSAPIAENEFRFERSNNSDINLPPDKVNQNSYNFLHANNNMWLEILEDGKVQATTCPTKYGALRFGTHQHEKDSDSYKDVLFRADEAGLFIRGVISQRYLCVKKSGTIYAPKEYHPIDCAFVQKPQFLNNGGKYHFYKHLHHSNTYTSLKKEKNSYIRRHKTVRFQLGFNENGTVFVVQKHTQRRKEHRPRLSINLRTGNNIPSNTKCEKKTKVKVKLRFKFCRKVWKNFFTSSVKDIRRFRKYNCWDKIREMRERRQKNKGDTG